MLSLSYFVSFFTISGKEKAHFRVLFQQALCALPLMIVQGFGNAVHKYAK